MACFILLSLMSCYILVYGDLVSLEESVNDHTYLIPNEIKQEKNRIKNDKIHINIPFHFNKQNLSSRHYDEHKKISLKDDKESGEYLRNYASTFDHMNFIYDHNNYNYNHNYKRNEHRDYNDNLNAAQHNSRGLQIFNQRDENQNVFYIASKSIDIFNSQLRNYPHEARNVLEAGDFKSAFFSSTPIVEFKSYITNRPEKRFNSYSNAPESIFHTQVNVNSPGSKLNVANNFPLLNDISTEVNDADQILVPVMDEAIQKTDEGIYSVEVIRTPNTTQVHLLSNLRDDGYHYDRPRMNFFY